MKEELIRQAKERGISSTDAHVLSIDPFFCGTPKDYEDAEWSSALWDKMMSKRKKEIHLRGFHYWVQSKGVIKPQSSLSKKDIKGGKKLGKYAYEDSTADWQYLLHCSQVARYLGIGTWENLIDLKHPDPSDYDSYYVTSGFARDGTVNVQEELNTKLEGLVDDFISRIVNQAPRFHSEYYQTYHCEVWCEKGSMGFVIEPACRKYKACYQSLVGQASVEKVRLSYDRALKAARVGKKVRIFYIADFDRYGKSMIPAVARKLEFFAKEDNLDIKLTRLALTKEQIDKFNLPWAPKHGEDIVELDALEAIHPGELGRIVQEALAPYYDSVKPKVVEEENRKIRDRAKKLVEEQLREPLEQAFVGLDLEGLASDFTLKDALDKEFEAPEVGHDVEEGDGWVYDSNRSYWNQWEAYKRYKGSKEEEVME